jgi:hypothetical protein
MNGLRKYQIAKITSIALFCLIVFAQNLFAVEHETNYDFQDVEIGSSSYAAVNISNPGDMSVNLKVTLSGDTEFEAITDLTNLFTVAAQKTINIEIMFIPTAVGERSAEIIINDGTPFYLSKIKLVGRGIEKNNQINISDIIEFYDSAVSAGTISGEDDQIEISRILSVKQNEKKLSKTPADLNENRLDAFRNMLVSVGHEIESSNVELACQQLTEIHFKTDGQNPPMSPPDFIFGVAKEDIANMISNLIQQLECH